MDCDILQNAWLLLDSTVNITCVFSIASRSSPGFTQPDIERDSRAKAAVA
jgi:hypothetical protein